MVIVVLDLNFKQAFNHFSSTKKKTNSIPQN